MPINMLISALEEISSESRQKNIWLGQNQSIIVTPEEIVEDLDYGIRFGNIDAIEIKSVKEIMDEFYELYKYCDNDVAKLVFNCKMTNIRYKASKLLTKIKKRRQF